MSRLKIKKKTISGSNVSPTHDSKWTPFCFLCLTTYGHAVHGGRNFHGGRNGCCIDDIWWCNNPRRSSSGLWWRRSHVMATLLLVRWRSHGKLAHHCWAAVDIVGVCCYRWRYVQCTRSVQAVVLNMVGLSNSNRLRLVFIVFIIRFML